MRDGAGGAGGEMVDVRGPEVRRCFVILHYFCAHSSADVCVTFRRNFDAAGRTPPPPLPPDAKRVAVHAHTLVRDHGTFTHTVNEPRAFRFLKGRDVTLRNFYCRYVQRACVCACTWIHEDTVQSRVVREYVHSDSVTVASCARVLH